MRATTLSALAVLVAALSGTAPAAAAPASWSAFDGSGLLQPRSVTADAEAPTVTIDFLSDGDALGGGPSSIRGGAGVAEGDAPSVEIQFWAPSASLDTPAAHSITASVIRHPRTGSGFFVRKLAASDQVPDGTYQLRIRQSDTAGNVGYSSVLTIRVDQTPPDIAPETPAHGAYVTTTTPTFSGKAGDAEGDADSLILVLYDTDGKDIRRKIISRTGATFEASFDAPLAPGEYGWGVEQIDELTQFTISNVNKFVVDPTAPTVAITAPAADATTTDRTPTITGTAGSDAGDDAAVRVRVYEGAGTTGTLLGDEPVNRTIGAFSATLDGAILDDRTFLAPGTYTVAVDQSDSAGNAATQVTRTFTVVDGGTPAPTITTPGVETNDLTPVLSGLAGTAEGDAPLVRATITKGPGVNGAFVGAWSPAVTADGKWSYELADGEKLDDGVYTLQVKQSDDAGKEGDVFRTFVVDTVTPDTKIDEAPKTGTARSATVRFSSTDSTAEFTCSLDGAAFAPCTSPRTYSGLSLGKHTVRVRAADAAGNADETAAEATWTVLAPPAKPADDSKPGTTTTTATTTPNPPAPPKPPVTVPGGPLLLDTLERTTGLQLRDGRAFGLVLTRGQNVFGTEDSADLRLDVLKPGPLALMVISADRPTAITSTAALALPGRRGRAAASASRTIKLGTKRYRASAGTPAVVRVRLTASHLRRIKAARGAKLTVATTIGTRRDKVAFTVRSGAARR